MPSPVSLTVDPFAGGQIQMDQGTFAVGLDMLKRPANDPANVAAHQDAYLAAMLIDLRQRVIDAMNTGQPKPSAFRCPVCKQDVSENAQHQSYECRPCGRGFSHAYILNRYFQNAQAFKVPPATGVTPVASGLSSTPAVPKLTGSVAIDREIDMTAVKVEEKVKDEPVRQYRAWVVNLQDPREEWKLRSVTHKNEIWPGMEPMHAVHSGGALQPACQLRNETSPSWHCTCGIYGVRTLIQALKWGSSSSPYVQVVGKASFWGRVHHYENGLRAEYAYPWEIYIPDDDSERYIDGTSAKDLKQALETIYGVEVLIDSGMFDLGLSHV